MISGTIDVIVDGRPDTLASGAFARVPAGTTHTLGVHGDDPARVLIITSSPARSLQMYEALHAAFAAGPPDPAAMAEGLAALDMQIIEAPATV